MLYYELGKADMAIGALKICEKFLHSGELPQPGTSAEAGCGIRCNASQYETARAEDVIWEAHKAYVDVHCILSGEEKIGVALTSGCETGTYSAGDDYLPVSGEAAVWVTMRSGTALCLFPNDAHKVRVRTDPDRAGTVKKVVFKVPVELF